jgi:hypothetical protein
MKTIILSLSLAMAGCAVETSTPETTATAIDEVTMENATVVVEPRAGSIAAERGALLKCIAVQETCDPKGKHCCDGSQCAGILYKTCQTCNEAPQAQNSLCAAKGGNQCCGGSKNNFVGVHFESNVAICLRDGDCKTTCTRDSECASGEGCFRVEAGSQCCGGEGKGICGMVANANND